MPSDRDERRQRILAVVDSIPRGRVATYGQVAREAGLPRHARLVGKTLASLPPATKIPWHRVLNAAGKISLRGGVGPTLQARRLRREGVVVTLTGRVDLRSRRWTPEP